jgi:hypothetical protein
MKRFENKLIACSLTTAELRDRQAGLLAQFSVAVLKTEELPEGYAFHRPGERSSIDRIAELIAAERECCPFLTFEVAAQDNMGPLIVRVTGPAGAKEFVSTILCNREEAP